MEFILLENLRGKVSPNIPVWLMRQAGRYMPEYRALKEQYSFLELCRKPELAEEVTFQPIQAFKPDAAILFSDILILATALGFEVDFNPGPFVKNQIKDPTDVEALCRRPFQAEALSSVYAAIERISKRLQLEAPGTSFLGFAGAPWTMCCYLLSQGPLKHFHGTQVFLNKHPQALHQMLEILTDATYEYLRQQCLHGVHAVQLFDSWGGNLSIAEFEEFSLPYLNEICTRLKRDGFLSVLYVGNAHHLLPLLKRSTADGISVDWRTPLEEAVECFSETHAIQGNLDPAKLFLSPERLVDQTNEMLKKVPASVRYIANLGHGVLQGTPPEHVKLFIETVQRFKRG